MNTNYLASCGVVALCATVAVSAQTIEQPRDAQPSETAQRPTPTTARTTTTFVGCLYSEKDVASLEPNLLERAGIGDDYILMNAEPEEPVKPAAGTPQPGGRAASTGVARGTMFRVEGLDDDRLAEFAGRYVAVTGQVDADWRSRATNVGRQGSATGTSTTAGAKDPGRAASTDGDDLLALEATSIRAAQGGTCRPMPAASPNL
jgi:hypothetical protein